MKKSTFITLLGVLALAWGCVQAPAIPEKDVYTDLFTQHISETDYYKNLATGFFNDSEYDKAVEYFKLSLEKDPTNSDSRYWLGVSFYKKNQSNLALVELEKLDVTSFEYSRLKVVSEIYESVGSFDKVLTMNQKIYELHHENFPLWKIFEMNMKSDRFDQALDSLSNLEKNGENPYRVHMARFTVYRKQKTFDKALAELQLAEKLKPLDFLAMKEMTAVYYEMKNWQDLYQAGMKYNKYHPFDETVSEHFAQACIQIKAYDDAIAEFKKQKFAWPDSMDVDFKIVNVLLLKNEYVNPEDLYKELYSLTKSDLSVYYVSKIHLSNEDYETNASKQESLASWSDIYPSVQIKLSQLEWKNDKHELALSRLERAHKLNLKSSEIYQEYGQYLIWDKKFTEAANLAEEGIKSLPADENIRLLAAYSYIKLNDQKKFQHQIDKAKKLQMPNVVKAFEKCLSVKPSDALCADSVADIYKQNVLPPSENRIPAESIESH